MNTRDALVIDRLAARFHGAAPLPAERCERWLNILGDMDGEALTAGLAGPDEWLLIRRLPLALCWRADSGEADVLAQWHAALRRALEEALAHPAGNEALRYPSRRAALADLLYRSALGETARQWAWQRMGLIPRTGLSPAEALGHGLAALLAAPELIWPVLSTFVAGEAATAALTALLRTLPAADWLALLWTCPRTAGYLAAAMAAPAAEWEAEAISATSPMLLEEAGEAALQLLRWAQARRHFAVAHREALAVLIAALAWPATGAPPALLRTRLQAARSQLPGPATESPHPEAGIAKAPPATARSGATPPPARPVDLPPLPALPQAGEWLDTAWGGALFWLARIPAGHLLDWQAAQDQVSLPLLLRAVGEVLGVPPKDPALRALCGGDLPPWPAPPAPSPLAGRGGVSGSMLPAAAAGPVCKPARGARSEGRGEGETRPASGKTFPPESPPADTARTQAALQVAQWAAWLDEAAPELPEPRLAAVCRRDGRLRFEPGWIELHLPLANADASIRRLGLDLDPGWLPWLGCVVRFVYDD